MMFRVLSCFSFALVFASSLGVSPVFAMKKAKPILSQIPAYVPAPPSVVQTPVTKPNLKPDTSFYSDGGNPSLVHPYTYQVNPWFKTYVGKIVHFDSLAYKVTKQWDMTQVTPTEVVDPLFAQDLREGWLIYVLHGKTGVVHDDRPGIIAYHPDYNVVIIALRGSRNAADWLTNLDSGKARKTSHGLNVPGKLHHGYALKTRQFSPSLISKLDQILLGLPKHKLEETRFWVSGHSKGGAVAHLATVTLVVDILKRYYGPKFSNKENRVQLFRISSPRTVGDDEAHTFVTRSIGEENEVHQYVYGDPATVFPGGTLAKALLTKLLGETVGSFFAGYKDTGYSAIQMIVPTAQQNLQQTPSEGGVKGFFKKLYNFFASFHMGSTKDTGRAHFDPSLVDLNTEKLLLQGLEFETLSLP